MLVSVLIVVSGFSIVTGSALKQNSDVASDYHSMRHARDQNEIRHLRGRLDNVILRQKTDAIIIQNLHDGFNSLQREFQQLSNLLVAELQKESVGRETSPDLSETVQEKSTESLAPSTSRVDTTISWVVEILPLLQRNVEDLQEEFKLQKEMHDKQELEAKVDATEADVAHVRITLDHVTSRAESAAAAAATVGQEMAAKFKEIGHLQSTVAGIEEQIGEQNILLDQILKSYPDGYFATENKMPPQKIMRIIEYEEPSDLTKKENTKSDINRSTHHSDKLQQQDTAKLMRSVNRVETRQRKRIQDLRRDVNAMETVLEEDLDKDQQQTAEITREKNDIQWALDATRDIKSNMVTLENQVKGLEARTALLESRRGDHKHQGSVEDDTDTGVLPAITAKELTANLKAMIAREFQLKEVTESKQQQRRHKRKQKTGKQRRHIP